MTVLTSVGFVASLVQIAEISLERELETKQGFRYNNNKKKSKVVVDKDSFRTARLEE